MLGARREVNGPIGREARRKLIRSKVEPDRSGMARFAPPMLEAPPSAKAARPLGGYVSRVAIVGSCITRDLWPILGEAPQDLLYISRTSLPSLFSPAMGGIEVAAEPPNGLRPSQHAAVVADLKKSALSRLVAHQPTHIIFDFIDERYDLLSAGGALATHSWELETAGYRASGDLAAARTIPRLSDACGRLWGDAAAEMASFLASTPLRGAILILHAAQWADSYRTKKGKVRDLADDFLILDGKPGPRAAHNALLTEYQGRFLATVPGVRTVSTQDHRVADEDHRWGLSPFHYVADYYRAIGEQLRSLGV